MTNATRPKPPAHLGRRGRRFWTEATEALDLNLAEDQLVIEIAGCLDDLDQLKAATDLRSIQERRLQRLAFGRLVAQLGLPDATIESPATIRARKAATTRWAGHEKRGA